MSAWKTASLGETFDIARGGSPRPIQDYLTDDPDGVNWISISDASASDKFINETKKRIRPEGISRSRMVNPGDFLLTNSMSFGRPYIMGTSGCIHDGWLVLSSKHGEVDQDYFFHLLGSDFIYAKFTKLAAGATVKNLNIDLVSGVEVSFPPLEEQRRIAAILDQAETLRTQRRAALAHLDSLTQSLFLDMFGDPVVNPKGWPVVSLTDICHCYSGGTPSKANSVFWKGHLPWFSAKDMKAEDLFDSEDHIAETVPQTTTLKLLPKDTVAIVVRGMILAHTFPVCVLRVPATINQDLKALIPAQPIDAQFLAACLRSQSGFVLEQVSEAGHGTKRLDAQGLQKICVLRPGAELEQTFATRIQAIEALKATHRAALVELGALFASLQQRAFSGELGRPVSAAVATHTKADLSALCTLDVKKMLESLIYVAKRMPGHDFYKSLKALYAGDRQHLENHGSLIYGETYEALDHGPVPKAAYALTRKLEEATASNLFADDPMSIPLRRTGNQLIPARDADFSLLSAAERKSLDWAIKYFAPMSFGETKTATHDSAYLATAPNAPIAIEAIIRTLPEAAQRRFFG